MSNADAVTLAVERAGLSLAHEILDDFGENNTYIVPVFIEGMKNYKDLINKLLHDLKEQRIKAQIITVDNRAKLLQQAIQEILKKDTPSLRDVTISSEVSGVGVFIEVLSPLSTKANSDIRTQVTNLLSLFGIEQSQIYVSANSHRPTNTEIISTIRTFAPISLTILLEKMIEQGYDIPAIDWLNHKLDSIRKANLVIKKSNSEYALTLKALLDFGSGKDGRSPDVRRFLALARRTA